jgi:hypothetical protein
MKKNEKKGKGSDVAHNDDSLGENTEQTPLAKEVKKDQKAKKQKGSLKNSD